MTLDPTTRAVIDLIRDNGYAVSVRRWGNVDCNGPREFRGGSGLGRARIRPRSAILVDGAAELLYLTLCGGRHGALGRRHLSIRF